MASRPWAELCGPAIALAEEGFIVPSGLAFAWAAQRDRLAAHPHAVRHFLKPDGTAYRAGERFRQPALARLLRRVAAAGPRALHEEEIARDIAVQIEEEGGPLRESDLRGYRAVEGSLVWGRYKDWTIAAPGAQAWGHTLVEMLQIADRFEFAGDAWSAPEAEALALVMLVALDDRPQEIGTLKAKPHGLPLDLLADAEFAAKRANEISAMVDGHGTARENALRRLLARLPPAEDRDTTHFSIVDAEGTAVSLTCSLGPHFGSATASARHGFLFAHSYRMLSDPSPGARDATEMCPAMLTSAGPTGTGARSIALGAAGSERIPGAIALTAVNLVEHRRPEGEAVAAPRLTWKGGKLRAHCDLTPAILDHLRRRGFPLEPSGRGYSNHLGIVHLAGEDGAGRHTAAADPAFDGTAAVVS
jgi:gamma-glutamyltranspeptidase/glutathione hydrolase